MIPARTFSVACLLLLYLSGVCLSGPALAKVSAIHIDEREPVLNNRPFGDAGPYELIRGRVKFEWDPLHPRNAAIADIRNAEVNRRRWVEAQANFMLLRPVKACEPHCVGLLEVSNRGHKAALAFFNSGSFSDYPQTAADFGDGLLMQHGFTLIWLGWQFDVPAGRDRLRIDAPRATRAGTIRGLVRSDWTVDAATKTLPLAHREHIPYPPTAPESARHLLTERSSRLGPRRTVARDQWRFIRIGDGSGMTHILHKTAFDAGKIYELTYVAEDPAVAGVGLAAVRDFVSHLKHAHNPVRVDHALAFGVSQSGRFLRHFLHQGFNMDEAGRPAFDGMLIHAAGAGRGSFNHRFAQPSRDAHRYSAFFYPTDLFPFTTRIQQDPYTGRCDALLRGNARYWPKLFFVNSGYEYWGRAAALTHTSVDGRSDVDPLDNERIYHLAGTQHFISPLSTLYGGRSGEIRTYEGNPIDSSLPLRALLFRLKAWVLDARRPPASRIPSIAQQTLVPIENVVFPRLPGVPVSGVAHQAYRVDYGPRWRYGIIDNEPPILGKPFPTHVPQVDSDGNELGGVRGIELRVPLGTYYPWHLRTGYRHQPGELMDFFGTFIPFASDETQRQLHGDPRPSITARYAGKDSYLARVEQRAVQLVEEGFLLQQDVPRATRHAAEIWDFVHRND